MLYCSRHETRRYWLGRAFVRPPPPPIRVFCYPRGVWNSISTWARLLEREDEKKKCERDKKTYLRSGGYILRYSGKSRSATVVSRIRSVLGHRRWRSVRAQIRALERRRVFRRRCWAVVRRVVEAEISSSDYLLLFRRFFFFFTGVWKKLFYFDVYRFFFRNVIERNVPVVVRIGSVQTPVVRFFHRVCRVLVMLVLDILVDVQLTTGHIVRLGTILHLVLHFGL